MKLKFWISERSIDHMDDVTDIDKTLEYLAAQRAHIVDKVRVLEARLSQSVRAYEFDTAERIFEQIIDLQRIALAAGELKNRMAPNSSQSSYLIGTALLYEAFQQLSKLKTESILYVAGNRFGSSYLASQIIPPKLERSEAGYASANNESSLTILSDIERHGGLLSLYLHMHPGKGGLSSIPSPIDLSCQRRLEQGGFPAIGGIFSRDGYLRFFSEQIEFSTSISGKGVELVGKNLYRLGKLA